MTDWINRRFGTWRGLLRLLLAYAEWSAGRLNVFREEHPGTRRLVFVCLGNICRSAYAEKLAASLGLPAASVGLSTSTGAPSPDEARAAALRHGVDLSAHRAVNWSDFEVRPGDLFLAMEIRQARELRRRLGRRADVGVTLAGFWCTPALPHLHDPFTLSPAYFDTCFARVRRCVTALRHALPQAGAATERPL